MMLGLIGLILLAIGWIPETIKVIRERKARLDYRFGILYVAGSLLLAIYSLQIKDYIFLTLNLFVMLMSCVSLFFSLRK